jgi:hypothetical protein
MVKLYLGLAVESSVMSYGMKKGKEWVSGVKRVSGSV